MGTFIIPINFTKKAIGHTLLNHTQQEKRSAQTIILYKKHHDPAKDQRSSWRVVMKTLEDEFGVLQHVIIFIFIFMIICVLSLFLFCHLKKGKGYKILSKSDDYDDDDQNE